MSAPRRPPSCTPPRARPRRAERAARARVAGAFALLCLACSAAAPRAVGQETGIQRYLASLTHNTVRVEAAGRIGFGFIVGLRGPDLLIATARHTLGDDWGVEPAVCFPPHGRLCRPAEVFYLADAVGNQPALDLAILAVPDPGGIAWRPDVAAEARPEDEVWVIGRTRQWWISPEPGRVAGIDAEARRVEYRDLDVAPGVSGAPIIARGGIVAMHLQAPSGGEGHGLELAAIRERVTERTRGRWVLLPGGRCGDVEPDGEMSGRTVVVHMDPDRPGPALEAMARLRCAGALPVPRTVPDRAAWEGAGVVYDSGDLRAARLLQRLLAPLGRLETRLGEPRGDVDLWIR